MKIAIHNEPYSFSDRWIKYCLEKNIAHKVVNCYASDIIKQLEDCDVLMWQHSQVNHEDVLFAKQLLFSVQHIGKKVFPNFNTAWHFDDKVGQKYLLEGINAPLITSYVFYHKKEALNWIDTAVFPKVFKLRGGAGSSNVKLVKSKQQAIHLIKRAFGKGISPFDRFNNLKERYRKYREGKDSLIGVCKGIFRLFIITKYAKRRGNEKGYVYFQDFIPGNDHDIRVIAIGDKAFAIKRMVRKKDFRASGSGNIIFNKTEIDERCVQIAFEINQRIKSQCTAYDFVFDKDNNPLITEISYGFKGRSYDPCPGYWDKDLNWVEGKFNPYGWMIDNIKKD